MDAANVDLKAFTEDFYRHVCGGHLADVLDTLEYLVHETDVWVEITTLLIPGQQRRRRGARRDDAVDRRAPRPRRPAALHRVPPRLQDARRRPDAAVDVDTRPRRSRSANGVRYAYTGNVHDTDGGSTYCTGCGTLLDRTRLVPARPLPPHRRRALPVVRHRASRPLRRARRHAGAPRRHPGSDRRRRDEPRPSRVRDPAVAGRSIPATARDARARRSTTCSRRRPPRALATESVPKAIVVPHAGYVYSGPIAASALRTTRCRRVTTIRRRASCSGPRTASRSRPRAPRADAFAHAARRRAGRRRSARHRRRAARRRRRRPAPRRRAQPRGAPAVPPAHVRRRSRLLPLVVGQRHRRDRSPRCSTRCGAAPRR